jgi:hypothetical protein
MAGWGTGGFIVRDNRGDPTQGVAPAMLNHNVGVGTTGGLTTQTTSPTGDMMRPPTVPPPGSPQTTTPPPPTTPPPSGAPTSGYVFTPQGTKPWNDPSLAGMTWDPASQSYKAGTSTTPPPPAGGTLVGPTRLRLIQGRAQGSTINALASAGWA